MIGIISYSQTPVPKVQGSKRNWWAVPTLRELDWHGGLLGRFTDKLIYSSYPQISCPAGTECHLSLPKISEDLLFVSFACKHFFPNTCQIAFSFPVYKSTPYDGRFVGVATEGPLVIKN